MRLNFEEEIEKYGEGEMPVKEMIQKLMRDGVKADKRELPRICELDWEFNLSSIFVEVDTPLVNAISNEFIFQLPVRIETYISVNFQLCRDAMAPEAAPQ